MTLEEIKKDVLKCTRCELHNTKTHYVPGEGNSKADIVFIGEAPGANEDKTGKPFVGRAGQVLNELLESINLKREDIFITNILKCRPPGNRNPKPEEIQSCTPYLKAQIKEINPKTICTLGNYSTEYVFKLYGLEKEVKGISKLHGKVFKIRNLFGTFDIIPLYHPAVATYNPDMKGIMLKDIQVLKGR